MASTLSKKKPSSLTVYVTGTVFQIYISTALHSYYLYKLEPRGALFQVDAKLEAELTTFPESVSKSLVLSPSNLPQSPQVFPLWSVVTATKIDSRPSHLTMKPRLLRIIMYVPSFSNTVPSLDVGSVRTSEP